MGAIPVPLPSAQPMALTALHSASKRPYQTTSMAKRSSNRAVYLRGEETRARILSVAMSLFGALGFDRVTTRMIAAEAAVPAPSLRYYFDNKEGLYVACLNHIRTQLLAAMEPALKSAEHMLEREDTDAMLLINAYCDIQGAYFDHMLSRPNSLTVSQFVARHDLSSSIGGQPLPKGDGTPAYRMVTCFTRIIIRISGGALSWQDALLVAGLVNGQIEPIVGKRKGLADVGIDLVGERLDWLRRTVRQQTISALLLHRA